MKTEVAGIKVFQKPFGFQFTNPSNTSDVHLHTNGSSLVMMDKYMQFDLQLPSQRIYGLGERRGKFSLGEGVWTMWANGRSPVTDDGTTGDGNSYGVHPFALVSTNEPGIYFGIYFRNSNAQSVVITHK